MTTEAVPAGGAALLRARSRTAAWGCTGSTADAAAGNLASQHVLERAGFVRIGLARQDTLRPDGTWADSVTYDQLVDLTATAAWVSQAVQRVRRCSVAEASSTSRPSEREAGPDPARCAV